MELHLKPRILILCTGNSCRSQMAGSLSPLLRPGPRGLLRGDCTARAVHPKAIRAMEEVGLQLTGARPKSVDEYLGQPFDYVITVCDNAKETCPLFTGNVRARLHMGFDDPAAAKGTEEEVSRSSDASGMRSAKPSLHCSVSDWLSRLSGNSRLRACCLPRHSAIENQLLRPGMRVQRVRDGFLDYVTDSGMIKRERIRLRSMRHTIS